MRFASLQNTNRGSSFATAGKAVADSSARVFDTASKFGPKYGEYSKMQMKTKAEESIAGIQAAQAQTKAGIKAVADVKKKQIDVQEFNQRQDLENKGRKAGVIAAIGKVAGAGFLAATDNTKGRERPKGNLRELIEANTASRAALRSRQEQELDDYGPFKSEPFKSSTGNDPGKGTSGTGSTNVNSSLTGNQKIVADAIAKYESGDWGYEAFNQGGAKGGTQVLGKSGSHREVFGKSLTDMTLGEIFHRQNTKQRGLSMSEHLNSGGLHAVGRYQFIGPTLQDEVRRMGLSSDTKFTPQVQDQIWLNHIKRVGNISPWVGPSKNYSADQKQQFSQMISQF